ncbi:hypothetical protein ACFYP4_02530 [Streptomyces sp. NPDC005551]|uniref:hypothetical protein n=1 Tax=Streptomyces sp. NPDC005551 TaxID=3364725 RepID=UPI003679FFA5
MAKPRKRRTPRIPSIQPLQRKGKAGQARDTHMLRQTSATGPDGVTRPTGNGDGRGSYGPNRLHGQAQSKAMAQARKNYKPATIRAMDEFVESGDVSRLLYYRTNTINPARPRTKLAGYDGKSHTVRVLFRYREDPDSLDGAIYEYYNVPYRVWRMVKRNVSTGRTINRTLNNYPYAMIRQAAP